MSDIDDIVTRHAASRPPIRYHGGKWRLAPWIISHFGPHRVYVEPFGGGGSVLIRKPRAYAEVYNDLSDGVVNLFRVLRDPDQAARLIDAVRLTPFARCEFEMAYAATIDPVESARRLIIRAHMGFGSNAVTPSYRTGFRANSNRSGTTPARDWTGLPAALERVAERFRGVVIEHRDAMQVMATHDGADTLHYVDPPYLPETRSMVRRKGAGTAIYEHEMSVADHERLIGALAGLRGAVVLSGYRSDLYDAALVGWRRVDRATHADGARDRVECLWLNPRAANLMPAPMMVMEGGRD